MNDKQIAPWVDVLKTTEKRFNKIASISKLVNYETESLYAMQSIMKNDYLAKIANNNPVSFQNAVFNIANIGLSLNPAMQYAYLVPRDGQCILDISYKGLIKLATDSGSILWVRADMVYSNDTFKYKGAAAMPVHEADVFDDRGDFKGVYCIAKTKEGDYLTETMSAEDIYHVRDKSQAYISAKSKNKTNSVWHEWFGEMAKKTIIKRASKTWPRTDKNERLSKAIEVINESEGIEFDTSRQIDDKPIDYQRVEQGYIKAIECVDAENALEGSNMANELMKSLTPDEQIAVNNKLKSYKPDKRQYNTLFRECLEYNEIEEPELPEHLR